MYMNVYDHIPFGGKLHAVETETLAVDAGVTIIFFFKDVFCSIHFEDLMYLCLYNKGIN